MERLPAQYKEKIEDDELEDMLLRRENIPVIEELLIRESENLERLKRLRRRKELKFGKKIKREEMLCLYPEICREVNDFLGVGFMDMPNAEYFSLFRPELKKMMVLAGYGLSEAAAVFGGSEILYGDMNPRDFIISIAGIALLLKTSNIHAHMKIPKYDHHKSRIVVEKTAREKLIPIIAHEYTHHIQRRRGINKMKWSVFMEGHARGVQRKISQNFMEREDNEAFMYNTLDITLDEFKKAYEFMCEELGIPANKNLVKTKTGRYRKREINSYDIGNALFSILKEKHGDGIYRKMIHGNFSFS